MKHLRLPNEVFLEIFENLDRETLRNVRLASHVFRDLGSVSYFESITLPGNYDGLLRAVSILTRDHIAKTIREVIVPATSMFQKDILEELLSANETRSLTIGLPITIGISGTSFLARFSKLIVACSLGLRRLVIQGCPKEEGAPERSNVLVWDAMFIRCAIEVLSTVKLPSLELLRLERIRTADVMCLVRIYFTRAQQPDANVILGNMNSLQTIEFTDRDDGVAERSEDNIKDRVLFLPGRGLRSVTKLCLVFESDWELEASCLDSFAVLKHLVLHNATIKSSLSKSLEKLVSLQTLDIRNSTIATESDTWKAVCNVIVNLIDLRSIDVSAARYREGHPACIDSGLCSPFAADKKAYRALISHINVLRKEGKMTTTKYTCRVCSDHHNEVSEDEDVVDPFAPSLASLTDFIENTLGGIVLAII